MGKVAFVFAGQGAQTVGMGKDLYPSNVEFSTVFDLAETIRPGTKEQCFNAQIEELSITINTQPCMYVFESALANSLLKAGVKPDAVAGFSLGEVAALTTAGCFTIEEGLKYILLRAESMNLAAIANPGKMAAILRIDRTQVEEVCARVGDVWAVNFNCPGQTVISGLPASVESAIAQLSEIGGKAIMLSVSGAFHTKFMQTAANKLEDFLRQNPVNDPGIPVYSNMTGEPISIASVVEQISGQVSSPVQWINTIEAMCRDGIDCFIEIGPGKVLSGLIKKINPQAIIYNVFDESSLAGTLSNFK